MRVAITGATGNVGTGVVEALLPDPEVESIVGVSRHPPGHGPAKIEWTALDVRDGDLTTAFRGADAVVHLAWIIQPSRHPGNLAAARPARLGLFRRRWRRSTVTTGHAGAPAAATRNARGAREEASACV